MSLYFQGLLILLILAMLMVVGCYRIQPSDDAFEHDSFEDDTEEVATDTSFFFSNDTDFILYAEAEELHALEDSGELLYYSYNTTTGEFEFLDVNMTESHSEPGSPFSDDAPSPMSFCMSANFETYDVGAGFMVERARDENGDIIPLDGTVYRGVAFWAVYDHGINALEICLPDVNTHPEGGRCGDGYLCHEDWCKTVTISQHWTLYEVLFEELEQSGPTKELESFVQKQIYGMKFQSEEGENVSVCVDDARFIR